MVIVFVLDNFNSLTDGTAMSARRFYEELTALGHTVRVVSYDKDGTSPFGLKEHKIPIVSNISRKSNIVFAKFNKRIVKEALTGADIVHLFLPFQVERKTLKLARKMKVPVSAAFHVHPENITKNAGLKKTPAFVRNILFWIWRKSLFDKVNYIHCPSEFIADELKSFGYKANLNIISNGVSECYAPTLDKLKELNTTVDVPIQNKKFQILMTGRFAVEKRQDLLIKAIEGSKHAKDICVTFAGSGPQKEKLVSLAKNLPQPANFVFYSQSELLEKIRSSDLYIHAADIEIEGISCIEAFSCGLVPVIGNAKRSATKQFAIDERCSFTASDADNLREKIDYWFEHPAELKKMSLRYIEYAKSFSLKSAVDSTIEMFKNTQNSDYYRYVNLSKSKNSLMKSMRQNIGKSLEFPDLLAEKAAKENEERELEQSDSPFSIAKDELEDKAY